MLEDRFMTIEQLHEYIREFLEVSRLELEQLQEISKALADIADFLTRPRM